MELFDKASSSLRFCKFEPRFLVEVSFTPLGISTMVETLCNGGGVVDGDRGTILLVVGTGGFTHAGM